MKFSSSSKLYHYIARIYPAAATADKYSTAYVGKIIALLGIGKKNSTTVD